MHMFMAIFNGLYIPDTYPNNIDRFHPLAVYANIHTAARLHNMDTPLLSVVTDIRNDPSQCWFVLIMLTKSDFQCIFHWHIISAILTIKRREMR